MKSIREHLPTGIFLASLGLFVTVACNNGSSSNNGGNTSTSTTQIDRVGLPAVNTALLAAARKDEFNLGDPRTDVAKFRAEISPALFIVPSKRGHQNQMKQQLGRSRAAELYPSLPRASSCR
jgi:hypothetical protein